MWLAAGFGVAWNPSGLVQLADFVSQTRTSLMMKGMTQEAATLYYGLPARMKAVVAQVARLASPPRGPRPVGPTMSSDDPL